MLDILELILSKISKKKKKKDKTEISPYLAWNFSIFVSIVYDVIEARDIANATSSSS